jgi:hypothetical protein
MGRSRGFPGCAPSHFWRQAALFGPCQIAQKDPGYGPGLAARRLRRARYQGVAQVTVPPILLYAAISLSARGGGRSWIPGRYPARRHGGDASERGGTNVRSPPLPPMSPPHAPCSPSAGAVAWPPTLLPTPVGLLRHPFTPHRVAPAGLLSVAVLRHGGVTAVVPPLAVSRGGLPPEGGRGVGKFLWGSSPAAAHHLRCGPIIPYAYQRYVNLSASGLLE